MEIAAGIRRIGEGVVSTYLVEEAGALATLDRLERFGDRMARKYPGGPTVLEAVRAERARDDADAADG
jgi:hypothetical protein